MHIVSIFHRADCAVPFVVFKGEGPGCCLEASPYGSVGLQLRLGKEAIKNNARSLTPRSADHRHTQPLLMILGRLPGVPSLNVAGDVDLLPTFKSLPGLLFLHRPF
jgi:hypothetical protein